MSAKDREWVPERELNYMEAVIKKVLENINKMGVLTQLCDEQYQENADGLTAQQIINIIKDFLKDNPNEVSAYVFFHLLAYYPKSMTSHNLTPLMQGLIALAYYYSQNTKEVKLSMDNLAELFHRSKSTIHDAIQKHSDLEKMLKQDLEEDKLRIKAKKEAYQELIEEEKQKLRLEQQNNKRIGQMTEQTPIE